MREHRQHLKTARAVDDDYTAWLDDEPCDDDFAAGVAAMREVERDWWAGCYDT